MKGLLTGLFVFFCIAAWPQSPKLTHLDSLEKKLQILKPGHTKTLVELQLFRSYLNSDSKKALALANTSLTEAQQLKNDSDICIFYNCIGEAYIYLENFKGALTYLNKQYNLAEKTGNQLQTALALTDLSSVYQNQSDYSDAESYSFKALTIYEQLKDHRQTAICYFNIGVTYNDNSDYKKAIFYGEKALDATKGLVNSDVIPSAYTLIGSSWSSLNNNFEGRKYFEKALAIYKKSKNDYGIAIILYQLFSTYPGEYQKQIGLGLQAQTLWNKIAPENFYSIYNQGNLGSAYGEMAIHESDAGKRGSLFKLSQSYLTNAIVLAKKTNTKSAVIDLTDSLSVINAAMGDYMNAYSNLKSSSVLSDSVYSQENKNKIASLEGKHEIDLKNKQLLINQLEMANQTKQKWFLIAGLLAMVIIAGLIYYQSLQRRKSNTALLLLNNELDEANKTKTQFFSILNHDLRRPVAGFITFLNLQQNEPELISESGYQAHSKKLTTSAESLLETMEDLLLWSKGQMENFKPLIKSIVIDDVFANIAKLFNDAPAKIKFESDPGLYIYTDEHYLKTIMQNLTGNAVKATGAVNNPLITWRAWKTDGAINLSIRDNGPGATKEQLKALFDNTMPVGIKNGLGLHIVRDMAKAIGCTLTVNNQTEGIEIVLLFGLSS